MEEMASSEEYAHIVSALFWGRPWNTLAPPAVEVIGRKQLILFLRNGDVAATQQVIGIVTKQTVP